jgi:Domain of unknown function (DUF4157)
MELQRQSAKQLDGPGARVSAAPHPVLLQRKCACGGRAGLSGDCEACQENHLHPKRKTQGSVPASVRETLRAPGRPLDAATREYFAARFGHDFSRVQIHADDLAANSVKEIGAQAYTVGSHIAFGAGRYAPESAEGRRLLAHELAHVVQQSGSAASAQPGLEIGAANDAAEIEADRVAAQVASGEPTAARTQPSQAPAWRFPTSKWKSIIASSARCRSPRDRE